MARMIDEDFQQEICESGFDASKVANREFDDDGKPARTGGLWTSTAHIITAVIGSGVLSLAWGVAQLGWIGGVATLSIFAFITFYTSCLLADCYRSPHPVSGKRNYTYMQAVKANLGSTMADEIIVNGVASDDYDQTAENFYDFDRGNETTKVSDLVQKIDALEHEKLELVRENEEARNRIKKSMADIEGLKCDEAKMKERLGEMESAIEKSESDKKALEAVAARAAALETEVARLQHDLISAMSDGDEANAEARELKRMLEEKGLNIQSLEREKETLKETLEREVEEVKKANRELQKRIEGMEERESEIKREKVTVEGRLDEKEREIRGLKKEIEGLESVVAKKALELEKSIKEKKEVEVLKNGVEEALKFSEEKVKEMELKMIQLQKEVEEAEKVISGLKDKTVEAINGVATVAKKAVLDDEVKESKLQWPIVAAASGTIVAAAVVCYLQCGRRR